MALSFVIATSVDDVYPSSVLSAEALGSIMTIDDRLIGKAVDTLDGDKSFRLANLQLQFGLLAGGIPGQIRKSTAAIKAFLLFTILKQHLATEAIGDLLYEMLICFRSLKLCPFLAASSKV